jgi:Carboxypeptidase regulatory-like domain
MHAMARMQIPAEVLSVNPQEDSAPGMLSRFRRGSAVPAGSIIWLTLALVLCTRTAALAQQAQPPMPGTVSGTIVDQTGAAVVGARIVLARDEQSPKQEVQSGSQGEFSFAGLAPGTFQLSVSADGFATQIYSGTLHAGEISVVPPITLLVAPAETKVTVELTQTELAEEQIKDEEKQRVIGFIPNFYVSYVPDAAPLTPKQKFELAWRSTLDPVTFALTAAAAGLEQADNQYPGYGEGAQGYGKRFGAAYADTVTSTFIGGAILPSLFKQDPRYFYKGTGSTGSRLLYALANVVICKGDNRRWQPNYSFLLGDFASSGLSNIYYPAKSTGAGLTFENAAIGIGVTAAANVLQEFIIRKLTPNVESRSPSKS